MIHYYKKEIGSMLCYFRHSVRSKRRHAQEKVIRSKYFIFLAASIAFRQAVSFLFCLLAILNPVTNGSKYLGFRCPEDLLYCTGE